ncbi:MAG: hypothetical protein BRD50_06045 [Bacteroidetes bacterium SW_11_45_7]|nr:MAG: hypothetical protein BRD50_06045 [Bacteroidetes bacterium SW_11_45_7]
MLQTPTKNDLLNRIIDWLEQHRLINAGLVLLYTGFLLFLHGTFVKLSVDIMLALGRPLYNLIVGSVSIVLGLAFIGFLVWQVQRHPFLRTSKLIYFFITMTLMLIHYQFLFELNIEIIHSLQFAGLAFLLYPFTRRFGAAIIMGLPVMILDEWYQYMILFPENIIYFDFNDILMDVLGSALLLCGMWIGGVNTENQPGPFWQRSELYLLAGMILLTAIGLSTCHFARFAFATCDNTWFVFSQLDNPRQFWQEHPTHGSIYHVMPPVEGTIVNSIVCLFYMLIDTVEEKT